MTKPKNQTKTVGNIWDKYEEVLIVNDLLDRYPKKVGTFNGIDIWADPAIPDDVVYLVKK